MNSLYEKEEKENSEKSIVMMWLFIGVIAILAVIIWAVIQSRSTDRIIDRTSNTTIITETGVPEPTTPWPSVSIPEPTGATGSVEIKIVE